MTDTKPPSVSTPSRITDYFPPSPKPSQTLDKDDNCTEIKNSKIDLSNTSILLTPEPSPAKEKDADKKDKVDKSETDSNSSTEQPKCKQVLLEKYEEREVKEEKKTKGKGKKTTKTETDTLNKKKTNRKKKAADQSLQNSLLTDFYPVRRSNRRCKSDLEKDKRKEIEDKILNKEEDGLEVVEIENKGRGVVASKNFNRGEFVIEYAGNLIDLKTAKKKEIDYGKHTEIGCYMFYFTHKTINYCVDATAESGRLGRLINHSRTKNNCQMKLTEIKDRPYLMLVASRDIDVGEELLYDYGDRNKDSLSSHPWLNL